MNERINNTDYNERYSEFRLRQKQFTELVKDDIIKLTVNGIEVFNEMVVHGVTAHVNIALQDKGNKRADLTHDELKQAIKEYLEKEL